MGNDEKLHKEIDLIQANISRMANNSFLIKGWAVSLVIAVFALSNDKLEFPKSLFMFLPVLLFWYLDSIFLQNERMYRNKYKKVINNRLSGNFDELYNLDVSDKECILEIMFSKTIIFFYLPLFLTVLIFLWR